MVKRPAKPRNVRFLLRYQLIELAGKWILNEDGGFPTIKNGDIPGSYVSLPKGNHVLLWDSLPQNLAYGKWIVFPKT